ncbi:MAG TPA: hypothetical protein VHO25_05025 [Polyangiaceae bacterium]|nr:hypothetical protein [Polyangiaceae bacterium]
MSNPASQVKERFGDKAKLLAALEKLTTSELWLDRVSKAKSLKNVANSKLLKLHDTLSLLKKDFGSRAKLIDAILKAEKRSKDAGYKGKLESYPSPRLMDLHRALNKTSRAAEKKAASAAKRKPPTPPKAKAKAPAKKPAAAKA